MRRWMAAGLLAALAAACGGGAPAEPAGESNAAAAPGEACDPVGEIRFICGITSPEDLAVVPDSDWVVASGNQEGGRIQLVGVRERTTRVLFPAAEAGERLDAAAYPDLSRSNRPAGR